LARTVLEWMDRRGLITWEHRDEGSQLLVMTNLWPFEERPAYGPFIRDGVIELRRQGVACDVLFLRGYRTPVAYLAGGLAALLLPAAYPGKYRLLHCHGGETALPARLFLGGPVVASFIGTDILGAQVGGSFRLRIKCWLRSLVLRRHAVLMSATTTTSAEMETLLTPRARPRNTVMPQGTDRDRFRPRDRDEARRELGWPVDSKVVLFAGRADAPEKRIWIAEEVIDIVRTRIPKVELRIASGIPSSEMPLHYAAADCLLHTSVSEGSPNVVKEALACDLPVVATPAGDIRELLDGVEACVVREADPEALSKAVIDILETSRRSNGRALTEHLGVDAIARRTLDCYRELGLSVPVGPDPERD